MRREELQELHNIVSIENIRSIMTLGILSYRRAGPLGARSIANPEVQERRRKTRVPGGRWLHDYANLYVHARNPMLYTLKDRHRNLCILRVGTDVLDLPGVIVTDKNAARDLPRFYRAAEGIAALDRELVLARNWNHADVNQHYRHSGIKCAEVLVPDKIDPSYIRSIYVSCEASAQRVSGVVPNVMVTVNPDMFFQ
jgi:hypothetical protein